LAYADTPPPFFDPFKGVGQNFPAAWRIKNHRTPLAKSPDWLKAAPMRENLLASWRQSGQKQDPCPSLLNHNANYKRLLPPL